MYKHTLFLLHKFSGIILRSSFWQGKNFTQWSISPASTLLSSCNDPQISLVQFYHLRQQNPKKIGAQLGSAVPLFTSSLCFFLIKLASYLWTGLYESAFVHNLYTHLPARSSQRSVESAVPKEKWGTGVKLSRKQKAWSQTPHLPLLAVKPY